jgi:decaprenylphospho-beta-D-erythro-pentofuranosid-2-ulose 2-reductase
MERVLVLGATSAIAAQVAELHAARGDQLHLVGRTASKLQDVIARCGRAATFEVADFDALDANLGVVERAIAALGHVDRVVIAHGALGDQLESERTFEAAEATLRTNFSSVVSLLVPLANHLEARSGGRIGVMTSVAGDRGRPRNYTYGTAKGALHVYLQGVRSRLYRANVSVTTLKLGPVDTPMTVDHPKSRLFSKAEDVAAGVVRAMDRRVDEAYVPRFWAAIMAIVRNVPEPLFQRIGSLSKG